LWACLIRKLAAVERLTFETARKLLRGGPQGVSQWNAWRKSYPGQPNLRRIDLAGADLTGANLTACHLYDAQLAEANLCGTLLAYANLDFSDLSAVNLTGSNLFRASLEGTNLTGARLCRVDLREAFLQQANLTDAVIEEAKLDSAIIGGTIFANLDLRPVKDALGQVLHSAPSTIGLDTIQRSSGLVPEKFLRSCGLAEWDILAAGLHRSNLTAEEITGVLYRVFDALGAQPIPIRPIFISYSHAEREFVQRLMLLFDKRKIRYWVDEKDATPGRIDRVLDFGIRTHGTFLVVLSSDSVRSQWVEYEVSRALKHGNSLCPVCTDDAWKTESFMSGQLRAQIQKYFVLDFSGWRDAETFAAQSLKLLRGLELHYLASE
jgi:uncharacterized protein YjbI with pentapeptide repeats